MDHQGGAGSRHGNGTSDASSVGVERRFTILELGQMDLARRVTVLEGQQIASIAEDRRLDRLLTKLAERFENSQAYFREEFLPRFRGMESDQKRVLIGVALAATGMLWQLGRAKLGW